MSFSLGPEHEVEIFLQHSFVDVEGFTNSYPRYPGECLRPGLGLMPKRQTPCIVQPVQGLRFGMHAFGTQAKVAAAEVPWKWLFICRSHMDFLSGKCS